MNLVIDAQIFKGYFEEEVLELTPNNLTASAKNLFHRLGDGMFGFFDEGGHIKHEWSSLVENEWFDEWYSNCLEEGSIYEVPTKSCHVLRKNLRMKGFPSSRDFWYIKVCKKVVNDNGKANLISEDLDFYDPTKKGGSSKTRERIIKKCKGKICNYLKNKENITVWCLYQIYNNS